MGGFIDIAASILSRSEARLEVSAQNIANMTTPGYKSRTNFDAYLNPNTSPSPTNAQAPGTIDFSVGKQINTNNPYDLAILGDGFFVVNTDHGLAYTRRGQFQRGAGGRISTAEGYALQLQGGGDLTTKTNAVKVLADGSVTDNGDVVGKLEIVDFKNRGALVRNETGLFTTPDANVMKVASAAIRQGALEASNVSTADEMVAMMGALRSAETGQRLVNVYDDLMGRALSVFGQA